MSFNVAIIIPCYNHASVLRRTLESVANQSLQPAEVVVIDDGSIDRPEDVVDAWNVELPLSGLTVKFVRFEQNRGAPAARNEGARQTAAPYLLFLDADAELVPDALATMAATLNAYPEADFVYSDFYWGAKLFRGRSFDAVALRERNYIHTSSMLRRVAFPGFDETLKRFQDWDLWLNMTEGGSRGVWIDRPLYRIEPRRVGISRWLPSVVYRFPWQRLGWEPEAIRRHREAEEIIKRKHGLT